MVFFFPIDVDVDSDDEVLDIFFDDDPSAAQPLLSTDSEPDWRSEDIESDSSENSFASEESEIDRPVQIAAFDMGSFLPEDVSISFENDFVVIKAEHGERAEMNGECVTSRTHTRRLKIPDTIDNTEIVTLFYPDGVLSIQGVPYEGVSPGTDETDMNIDDYEDSYELF